MPDRSAAQADAREWLRGPGFDLGLSLGVLALALALGGVALAHPALFVGVLLADVWLLAYPHVASTYTRIAFDRRSARAHWFLLFALPPLVLAGTAGAAWLGGVLALNTIYFYWQSWHYTRQSYGIARAYRRDRLSDCVIYGFTAWGVLHRAHQQPPDFYGMPLWSPPAPRLAVLLAASFALVSLAAWTLRRIRRLRAGEPFGAGHSLFVLSHVVITIVAYLATRDVTRGWLFLNIWHNAQYLLFVWAVNARRFAGGVDPARPFLSRLCQPDRVLHYAAVCLGLGALFYLALDQATAAITTAVLPVILVTHLAVNFHHYLVDSVIWRSPRAKAARTADR
jgi:hypothetical protein